MTRRLLLIHNPVAGRRHQRYLDAVIHALRQQDCELIIQQTAAPGEGENFLRRYKGTIDGVIAAGGDGTLNEVLNGIRGRSCRLGLIPLGTSNVFSRELGLPTGPEQLAQLLTGDAEIVLYPGLANGRRFLLMCGVGFDAWVVKGVDADLKARLGKMAYLLTMARMLPRFGSRNYQISVDGKHWQANSLIISHARHYAGPFMLDREASLFSPHFNLVMLRHRSWIGLLCYLLALPTGYSSRLPGVQRTIGTVIQVEAPAAAEPIQIDGDTYGHLPLTVTLDPEPVRIAVGNAHPIHATDKKWIGCIA